MKNSTFAALFSSILFSVVFASSAMAQTNGVVIDNTVFGYVGTATGDWSNPGNVVGPSEMPNPQCANMGALDKVNLVSNFGFVIPGSATITGVTAFTKASSPGGQDIGVQLASNAAMDPPTGVGTQQTLAVFASNSGNCAVTSVTEIGTDLASWGNPALTPAIVNSSNFGMILRKLETSSVKVDSICMEVNYETDTGPAVVSECFAPPPDNSITVIKEVVGTAPGSDWGFTGNGDIGGAFTLPAAGGSMAFTPVADGMYTITETTKPGYTASVECTIDMAPGPMGSNEVVVDLAGGGNAVCVFTNTLNTAQFTVTKDFSDDNTDAVMVTLSCGGTTSIDSANPAAATEAAPAVFDVSGFGPADACTATEAAPVGYTADETACQAGGLLANGGTCEIVNTLNTAQFTVTKDFSDDNTDAVMVTLSCGGTTSIDSANPAAATEAAPAVFDVSGFGPADACTATEAAPVGYTADETACQAGGLLANGGTCEIVNTLNTAQFTVTKDFDDDNTDSVMVTLSCGGTTSIDSANPTAASEASPAVFDVSGFGVADACTATEAVPVGYTEDESACQAGGLLANGGTCEIVNTLNTAQFTVTKDFDDDNTDSVMVTLSCGGTTSIDSANPTAASEASPAVFDVSGFGVADACTATEAVPVGYTEDESACQAGGLLANGGTCEIVNTLNVGTFTVRKTYDDDNTDPVSVTTTCTSGTVTNNPQPASPGGSAIFNVEGFVDGATCTATEVVPDGYEADLTDCQDGDPINGGCAINNMRVFGPTTFQVIKHFTDGNPSDVEVTLDCFSGLPITQSQEINENQDVIFTVHSFTPGNLNCDVTEVIPTGYSPDYTASLGLDGDGLFSDDELGCHFDEVVEGRFICRIVNSPDPVDIEIEKLWVVNNTGGDVINLSYLLTLYCDGEIVDGDGDCCFIDGQPARGCFRSDQSCQVFEGYDSDIFNAQVIPNYPESHCWVEETVYDDAVEVDNDCGDLVVSAVTGGDSCLITNTVFFEGIPTLNQYAMLLMALMMMGVGAIGFRRFI